MGERWHTRSISCLGLLTPRNSQDTLHQPENLENEPRGRVSNHGLVSSNCSFKKLDAESDIHAGNSKRSLESFKPSSTKTDSDDWVSKAFYEPVISPPLTPFSVANDVVQVEDSLAGNLDGEVAESSRNAKLERTISLVRHSRPYTAKDKYLNCRLRPSQRWYDAKKSPVPTPTQSPDRFMIPRRAPYISREVLMVGKPTTALKYREKVCRRRSSHSDPFGFPEREENISSEPLHLLRPRRLAQHSPFQPAVLDIREESLLNTPRNFSAGAVWNVGGRAAASDPPAPGHHARTTLNFSSHGTPLYTSSFLESTNSTSDLEMHERRVALALGIDRTKRVLASVPSTCDTQLKSTAAPIGYYCNSPAQASSSHRSHYKTIWTGNVWLRENGMDLLEAPGLRDDFYCSVLAYSKTIHMLAVGLANQMYLWQEEEGVKNVPAELSGSYTRSGYITSLAFSSESGGRAILAIARGDGHVVLWSPHDEEQRMLRLRLSTSAVHVSFRPNPLRRPSQRMLSVLTEQELLLVGQDTGAISVYFVEWPKDIERHLFGWHGGILLHCQLLMHSQQICGIAWSTDGDFLATGGNDNRCCLVETNKILSIPTRHNTDMLGNLSAITLRENVAKHRWHIRAAVKAIAFCPWQRGLIAIGGGSNDRCVHFYHTISGACLATIDCAAQVTSLIWSTTRREIAATFGFAQPDHPFRIAVYSWPSCQQTIAIPWHDEMRALYAIAYPGGPEVGMARHSRCSSRRGRMVNDGCIVVAGSDGSIKFHEVWCESRRATSARKGLLGGSDILESLHGIEKEDIDTIR